MKSLLPLLVLATLGGCETSHRSDLVGKWCRRDNQSICWDLASDGTLTVHQGDQTQKATWKSDGDVLVLDGQIGFNIQSISSRDFILDTLECTKGEPSACESWKIHSVCETGHPRDKRKNCNVTYLKQK